MKSLVRPFSWKEYGFSACFVIAIAALSAGLQYIHVYERLSLSDMDTLTRLISRERNLEIVLVTIGNDEYRELFKSTSPLNQERVMKIIQDVDKAGPKAIGLDIETSDWNPALKITRAPGPETPIIWAMVGEENQQDTLLRDEDRSITEGKVYGLYMKDWMGRGLRVALPASITDKDGVVRRYYREFSVREFSAKDQDSQRWVMPGFATAFTEERLTLGSPPRKHQPNPLEEPGLVRFTGNPAHFRRIPASVVSDQRSQELMHGRIVVIGGTYRAARDKYATPVAYLDGMEILAYQIEAERERRYNRSLTKAPWQHSFAIDVAIGLVLLRFFFMFHPMLGMLLSTVGAVTFSLLISTLLFQTFSYFLDIAPAFGSAAIGILAELGQDYWRLLKKERGKGPQTDQPAPNRKD